MSRRWLILPGQNTVNDFPAVDEVTFNGTKVVLTPVLMGNTSATDTMSLVATARKLLTTGGMASTLGSRTCLRCGDGFAARGPTPNVGSHVLIGEVDVTDPIVRRSKRYHFKFHRSCFESFADHADRQRFMERAVQTGAIIGIMA